MERKPVMSEESAKAVYDLLVKVGGAHESNRFSFVHYHSQELVDRSSTEWRFQGHLAFGGKFYTDHDRWRVGCYREDDTPERDRIIEEMNKALEGLYEVHRSEP